MIRSDAFADRVMQLMAAAARPNHEAFLQLVGLGLSMDTAGAITRGIETDFARVWRENREQVLAVQAVGTWWCGDAAEKAAARRYLRDISGREFQAPQVALVWWRERFLGTRF